MNNHRTSAATSAHPSETTPNEEDQLNRINLQALQNRDPYIAKIIDQAQRVCVFKFSAEKREWERKDLEGTLFVYERLAAPFHGFVILSTVSRETFVQIIKPSMEFKHAPAYDAFLQYKVDVGDIYGIWFISKNDCPRVTECLTRLTSQAKDLEQEKVQGIATARQKDIFSLLSQAQEKFQESKRKPDGESTDTSASMPPLLMRLFSTQDTTSPSTINKPALSVAELEKQFLQPAETKTPSKSENPPPPASAPQVSRSEKFNSAVIAASTSARLMTPADFQKMQTPVLIAPIPIEPTAPIHHRPASTKEDLRQLLLEMLHTDEEFVTGLYTAYAGKHNLRYNLHS